MPDPRAAGGAPAAPFRPLVTVVMPVKDEGRYLAAALDAIDAQSYPRDLIEIIVVDGGSTDETVAMASQRARHDRRYRVAGGPGINCPAGMNIGIGLARGAIVAKVDGHGYIDRAFLATAVDYLAAAPDVGCVGGSVVAIADSVAARANALARFSPFGVGGGTYTLTDELQDAESVQCGVYRRAALEQVGGFDPTLQFGEDEELNYRIRRRGWRIVFHPAMRYHYYVRPTLRGLFRQYLHYGAARVAVVTKHPEFLRPKHVLPALLVGTLAATALASAISPGMRLFSGVLWSAYAGFIAVGTTVLTVRARFSAPHRVAGSLVALHVGYGLGTLAAVVRAARRRWR